MVNNKGGSLAWLRNQAGAADKGLLRGMVEVMVERLMAAAADIVHRVP